jgi:D-alanine-D-alanine ligase
MRDAKVINELDQLARDVYHELSLETLVRLDVRADAMGRLHVLEANPKPDLKAPTASVTSIVCLGLERVGMTYDDLILSLLADKIDVLFSQGRGTAAGLQALLG